MAVNNIKPVIRATVLVVGSEDDPTAASLTTGLNSLHFNSLMVSEYSNQVIDYVVILKSFIEDSQETQTKKLIQSSLKNNPNLQVILTLSPEGVLGYDHDFDFIYHEIQTTDDFTPIFSFLLDDLQYNSSALECQKRLLLLGSEKDDIARQLNAIGKSCLKRILIAGEPTQFGNAVLNQLERDNIEVVAALSVPQAVRYLETEQFDTLMINPGKQISLYNSLLKLVRRNDNMKALPVWVLTDDTDQKYNFIRAGANFVVSQGDTDFLRHLKAYSTRYRRHYLLNRLLGKAFIPHESYKGKCASLSFFESHLDGVCSTLVESQRCLSVSVFKLELLSGLPIEEAVTEQAIGYIDMVKQDSELVTVVKNDTVLVACSTQHPSDAILQRVKISKLLQEVRFLSSSKTNDYEDLIVKSATSFSDGQYTPHDLVAFALRELESTPRHYAPPAQTSLSLV